MVLPGSMYQPSSPANDMLMSVYNQCWPSPSFFRNMAGCQDDGVRPSKDWVRSRLDRHGERPLTTGITGSRVSLDKNTLKWRAWTSTGTPSVPSEGLQENAFDQPYHKLTANDYHKLNGQVKEAASAPIIRKSSTVNFKKYHHPASGDQATKLYRSQLASSLKTFNDKKWQTYENETDLVTPPRSRPGTSLSDTRHAYSRPGSSVSRTSLPAASAHTRPQSSPTQRLSSPIQRLSSSSQRPSSCTQRLPSPLPQQADPQEALSVQSLALSSRHNSYDNLTPEVVYALSAGPKPESVYGDRCESALEQLAEVEEDASEVDSASQKEESTKLDKDKRGKPVKETDQKSFPWNKHMQHNEDDSSDKETDLDSDEENYPEPPVQKMNLNDLPTLSLRPEKMDALDTPIYARGDRRKYDFDASVVDYPVCEFPQPLPENIEELKFSDLSMSDKNWRDLTKERPENPGEEYIIDRLVEFQRLQMKTIEWETAKRERVQATKQRQNKSKVYPTSRVQSAKTWREKKCCLDCLQLACVGDCPGKPPADSNLCPVCFEKQCDGNCSQSVYESRSRSEIEEEKPKLKPPPRPKSCNSCQQRHTAKMINANNLVLGRPKSGHATFSRGQNSYKPKDIRPKSGTEIPKELQIEFEGIGLEPTATERETVGEGTSRPGTGRRRTGRAGVLPGKSYFSQRRVSLTDKDINTEKVKTLSAKRVKSGRRRRPNTAA